MYNQWVVADIKTSLAKATFKPIVPVTMAIANLTGGGSQTGTFEELVCSPHFDYCNTPVDLFVISQHFPLPHCISWEYYYPCCPSQGIFSLSAVLTLVSLFGSNWSLRWSCYPASFRYLWDVHCSRRLESLSIRIWCMVHNRLRIMYGIFVDVDCNKRGQTSCPVVGAKIQTSCYFEANIYSCSYLLGCIRCRCFMLHYRSPYNLLVWLYNYTILSCNLNRLVRKDFSRAQKPSQSTSKSCWTATTEPTKCTEHGAIQKRSVQCTVGTVSISCLLSTIWYSFKFGCL